MAGSCHHCLPEWAGKQGSWDEVMLLLLCCVPRCRKFHVRWDVVLLGVRGRLEVDILGGRGGVHSTGVEGGLG